MLARVREKGLKTGIPSSAPPNGAVCLLSLNSNMYTNSNLRLVRDRSGGENVAIHFLVLDSIETINSDLLGLPESDGQWFHDLLSGWDWVEGSSITYMSKLEKSAAYTEKLRLIESLYEDNRSLRQLIHSMTFKALHFQLRQVGIRNQRHLLVEKLSMYVVRELALLNYLGSIGLATEYTFHDRGQVTSLLEELQFDLPEAYFLESKSSVSSFEAQNVTVGLGRASRTIGPIDFSLPGGQILGLIGPNGCGKTTILHALAGHKPIAGGELLLGEKRLNLMSPVERGASTVFQSGGLIDTLTVKENLSIGSKLAAKRARDGGRKIGESNFELLASEVSNTNTGTLSGGEGQLVSIDRSLLSSPAFLMLDEPTAALDSSKRPRVAAAIRQYVSEHKIPAIIVSHDIDFLERLVDRLLILDGKGQQLAEGLVGDVLGKNDSLAALQILGMPNIFEVDVFESTLLIGGFLRVPRSSANLNYQELPIGVKIEPNTISFLEADSKQAGMTVMDGLITSVKITSKGDLIYLHNGGVKDSLSVPLLVESNACANLSSMRVCVAFRTDLFQWLYE